MQLQFTVTITPGNSRISDVRSKEKVEEFINERVAKGWWSNSIFHLNGEITVKLVGVGERGQSREINGTAKLIKA